MTPPPPDSAWSSRIPRALIGLGLVTLTACGPLRLVHAPDVDRERFPDASAVVLSDHGSLRFASSQRPSQGFELTRHLRIKVLTPAGRHHGRVAVALDAWSELVEVSGRSYGAPDGQDAQGPWWKPESVQTLPDNAIVFSSMAREGGILYTDARVALFDVPGVEPGRVVDVRYVVRSKKAFVLPSWHFDSQVPVLESRFDVHVPKGWKLGWSYSEGGRLAPLEPAVTSSPSGDGELHRWEKRDLSPLETERFGLPLGLMARTLQVAVRRSGTADPDAAFATWKDLGAWYRGLAKPLEQAPEAAVAALGAALARSPEVPAEAAIFRFVRDRIRYVAIHEGLGAFRPHHAGRVYAMRYGDCKDMATLAVSLYRTRGIEAWPALVGTRGYGVFDPELPTLAAFNHMIVALPVDGGYRFVDPTAKRSTFEQLPWEVQGRQALVMRDGAVELVKTPQSRPEEGLEVRQWSLQDRAGRVSLVFEAHGLPARSWRRFRSGEANTDALRAAVRGLYAGDLGVVESVQVHRSDGAHFELRAWLKLPALWRRTAAGSVLAIGHFLPAPAEIRVPRDRRSPLVLGEPGTWVERIIIPSVLGTPNPPPTPVELSSEGWRYGLASRQHPDRLEVERKLVILRDVVEASRLPELRELGLRMTSDARRGVLLEAGGSR